jgi:hypothetical protein
MMPAPPACAYGRVMARAAISTLLLLPAFLVGAATAIAQDQDATESGHREGGESASNWYDLPFWAWILIAVGGFLLLFGVLYMTTIRERRPAEPEPEPAPAAAGRPAAAPRADGGDGGEAARDLAVATFPHIHGAERAYGEAEARDRDAGWLRETTFVEAHKNGRLVVRGTFAGRYLSVGDIKEQSPSGAAARAVVDAAFDDLRTDIPEGSSALLVFGTSREVDAMLTAFAGQEVTRRHISDRDAAALEALAAQAPPAAPAPG